MSDDQVVCEWVSVSSGTGLPGLSLTKAVKRLCVCVCVCVCVCARAHARACIAPFSSQELSTTTGVRQRMLVFK